MADLQTVAGQEFGTKNAYCYGCDNSHERVEPTHWWMGLDDQGQAHYSCTECAPGLFHVQPLMPLSR